MGESKTQFLPRETFEVILENAVIPTFDLILEVENEGIVFLKRKIEPYKNVWAFPGLRMFKGENIENTLKRIAKTELGLEIYTSNKVILGQFVGKFKTEKNRQDLSTGYYIKIGKDQKLNPNPNHFTDMQITYKIPEKIGAMYKYYFLQFQSQIKNK